jgi:hypothetical protein
MGHVKELKHPISTPIRSTIKSQKLLPTHVWSTNKH